MALGIGIGCGISGWVAKNRVEFGLVRLGACGTGLAFVAVAVIAASQMNPGVKPFAMGLGFFVAGGFAGLMAVPLQVFIQARPPANQKGRILGAMNLFTWIGILLSTVFYFAFSLLFSSLALPPCWILVALAPILLAIAIFFWPKITVAAHHAEGAVAGMIPP
jgi:hypothetical protein